MEPKSYYIELKGSDIKIWLDAIIIDDRTVIPNISVNSPLSKQAERYCNQKLQLDDHDQKLSHRGAIKFCEIVQLYYNKINNKKSEIDIKNIYNIKNNYNPIKDTYYNKDNPYDILNNNPENPIRILPSLTKSFREEINLQ